MKSALWITFAASVRPQIEANYIVKLKERPGLRTLDSNARLRTLLDQPEHTRSFSLLGSVYSARLSDAHVLSLRNEPDVEYVEKDFVVQAETVQKNAAWHLSRISHRKSTMKQEFVYRSAGRGITVYVVDSGINTRHPDFEGRARHGKTFYGATTGTRLATAPSLPA